MMGTTPATLPEQHRSPVDEFSLQALDHMAVDAGLPCGIPAAVFLILDSIDLSPSYAGALDSFFEECQRGAASNLEKEASPEKPEEEEEEEGAEEFEGESEDLKKYRFHRQWLTSKAWRGEMGIVNVLQDRETGLFSKRFYPRAAWETSLKFTANTMNYLTRYGVAAAERKAQKELEHLLNPQQKKHWLFTNSFYEKGKSGVVYWLRKNRPTVAFRLEMGDMKHGAVLTPLCALCLHPIGSLQQSFAGLLAPSDDLIAHLQLIRADEHGFWKKANQHPLHLPNAGIG
jgi:hypothetical protein